MKPMTGRTLPLVLATALAAADIAPLQAAVQAPAGQVGPADTLRSAPSAVLATSPDTRSEAKALRLSALGTGIPALVALATAPAAFDDSPGAATVFVTACATGVLVGPSLGHFYAGRPGRAWAGIGLRCAGSALLVAAATASFSASWGGGSSGSADGLAFCGLALVGGSMIYDIASAPHSARVHNAKHAGSPVALTVAPHHVGHGTELVASVRF